MVSHISNLAAADIFRDNAIPFAPLAVVVEIAFSLFNAHLLLCYRVSLCPASLQLTIPPIRDKVYAKELNQPANSRIAFWKAARVGATSLLERAKIVEAL